MNTRNKKWLLVIPLLAPLLVVAFRYLPQRKPIYFVPATACSDAQSERFLIIVLANHLTTDPSMGVIWKDGQESMLAEYSQRDGELRYGLNMQHNENPGPDKWIHIWRNVSPEAIQQVAKRKGILKDLKQFGAVEQKEGLWPKPPRRSCLEG